MKIFEQDGKLVIEGAEVQVVPLDTPVMLVVRSDMNQSAARQRLEAMRTILRDVLTPERYNSILIGCVSPGMAIEAFDESEMRAHGWQRIPKE